MKIMISSDSADLNGSVADRFARAPFFLVVDSDNMNFKVIENTFKSEHGMGPKIAKLAIDEEVNAIISATPGPNAQKLLMDSDITLFEAAGKKINAAIGELLNNG